MPKDKARAQRWENWLSTLTVCQRQVTRALNAPAGERDGEVGFAVVAVATMLEAYVNLHATEQFYDGEHLVPQDGLAATSKGRREASIQDTSTSRR